MTVPNVYNSTSRVATWDGEGIYEALKDEITANGSTNNISITDSTSTGMLVKFNQIDSDLSKTVRFSIRQGSTTDFISVGIAGDGTIDGAGALATAPTGTGSDWSGEKEYDWTTGAPASGSKMWTIMLDDAIIVFVTDPTNSFMESGLHFGRIYIPTTGAQDIAQGRDGLGFLMGVPQGLEENNFDRWLSATNQANSLIHHFSGSWGEAGTPIGQFDDDEITPAGAGVYAPPVGNLIGSYYSSATRFVGLTKYLVCMDSNEVPLTVRSNPNTNQGWLHFYNSAIGRNYCTIWDKTVTP